MKHASVISGIQVPLNYSINSVGALFKWSLTVLIDALGLNIPHSVFKIWS